MSAVHRPEKPGAAPAASPAPARSALPGLATSGAAGATPPGAARPQRVPRGALWFLASVIVLGGAGFIYKFYEFFLDIAAQEGFRFAGAHLLTYLLVAGGFLLMLLYAFLNGHFADIESPKFELLEREVRLDHEEFD